MDLVRPKNQKPYLVTADGQKINTRVTINGHDFHRASDEEASIALAIWGSTFLNMQPLKLLDPDDVAAYLSHNLISPIVSFDIDTKANDGVRAYVQSRDSMESPRYALLEMQMHFHPGATRGDEVTEIIIHPAFTKSGLRKQAIINAVSASCAHGAAALAIRDKPTSLAKYGFVTGKNLEQGSTSMLGRLMGMAALFVSGKIEIDLHDPESLRSFYTRAGALDADAAKRRHELWQARIDKLSGDAERSLASLREKVLSRGDASEFDGVGIS